MMIKDGKRIVNVMLITIVSRVSGFAREVALASVYGATLFTDAYLISTAIPSVIFTGIGMAIESVLISMYPGIIEKQGKNEAINFTNSLLNIIFLTSVITSLLAVVFVSLIVSAFAIGFKEETFEITVEFTKILLPGIIFIGIYYVFAGYLEINKKYEIPTIVKLPNNALIILCIFLSINRSIYILLYGTLIGLVIQAIIMAYYAFRAGFTYRFTLNIQNKNIKRMFFLVMPVFIGIAAQQLNVLVDKTLASTLIEGSVSALNYADKLNSFVYGVIILPIITVVYPTLSELAVKEDIDRLIDYIRQSIIIIVILVMPLSAGAMCLNTPIVKVLFQRGNFNDNATFLTAGSLFYYSIGMIGLGLSSFLTKVFYSLQDTRSPVIISGVTIIMNVILNLILIKYMDHKGLALATSISSLFGTALLLYKLRYKLGYLGGKRIFGVAVKTCIAAILMSIGAKLFYENASIVAENWHMGEPAALFSSIVFGGLIYFFLIIRMKIEEVNQIMNLARNSFLLAFDK